MKNKKALDFFQKISNNAQDEISAKLNNKNDFTHLDAKFILQYVDENTDLLDLASGTGLIINKIYDKVHRIVAIEPFEGFTRFIAKDNRIEILHENMLNYNPSQQFDLITLFGIMHYFNENEAISIYERYLPYLLPKGKIIIKNQFGIHEDVCVDGYSEEQKNNYYAHYRHIEKEKNIMEKIGYRNIKVFDIYPPECNRWDNTHFYAIVAEK